MITSFWGSQYLHEYFIGSTIIMMMLSHIIDYMFNDSIFKVCYGSFSSVSLYFVTMSLTCL